MKDDGIHGYLPKVNFEKGSDNLCKLCIYCFDYTFLCCIKTCYCDASSAVLNNEYILDPPP